MKALTRDQVQSRKEKAVRFTRDVLDDPDRADEIADESSRRDARRRARLVAYGETESGRQIIEGVRTL